MRDLVTPRPPPHPPYIVHIHTRILLANVWVGPLLSLGSRLCLFRLFRMNVYVTHHSTHIGPLVLTTVPKCALSKEKTMFP